LWRGWRDVLGRLGFATAALDAKLLASHALGLDALALATREAEPASPDAASRLAELIQRRMGGESVARIIGEREFYGLAYGLNAATLEPRPDTELLVDLALKALPRGGRILDLGTGTGCIPVSVLANRVDATGVATDLSSEALAMAQKNADRHGVGDRLQFAQGDWFRALHYPEPHGEPVKPRGSRAQVLVAPTSSFDKLRMRSQEQFDLILSNPPYIESAVIETLSSEVKAFDPMLALDGGPDGLAPYRIIAAEAGAFLKPDGQVLVEIGYEQGASVSAFFAAHGFANISVHQDLAGLDRVVIAHHMTM